MKTYNQFINEGVRHLMTPKSKEEISDIFKNLTPNEKLIKAADYGVLWALKEAIEEGADINYDNDSALRSACYNKDIVILKILLDNGANIQGWKNVLMNFAKEKGNTEVIKLIKQYTK